MTKRIAIIGGGAAGFFTAANIQDQDITIFEQGKSPMKKVKISGGGRCNVTHACFDPSELIEFYPRGKKELRSIFHRFQPGDTMEWFESRAVPLKIEEDNRVFPHSDSSLDIVNCLYEQAQRNGAKFCFSEGLVSVEKIYTTFHVQTSKKNYQFDQIIFTTGSSPKTWKIIESLGHSIVAPVPSLFTFKCKHPLIEDLMGVSFPHVSVRVESIGLEESGPLLITHWGFSGPAILKTSAWGAEELYKLDYQFDFTINFIDLEKEKCLEELKTCRNSYTQKSIGNQVLFDLTKRFWHRILEVCSISPKQNFADLSNKQIHKLVTHLTACSFRAIGKTTFKEEFVTAGGVDLKEVDFKNMESKLVKDLYFAGEVLNIDALTGGFNFQACWSEGFVIAECLGGK